MRLLFFTLLLATSAICFSQANDWDLSTSGQITTLDKVGVGIANNLQGVLSINNSDYSQKTLNMSNVNADISFSDHVLTFASKSSWTQVPYIQWSAPNGNRQAYLGWQKDYFNLTLDNGYDFSINGGKVGIGTASPSQLLDVNGIVAVNGQAVLFSDVSDIRMGDITGGDGLRELSIWSGDAERIRINQSGNVGIGTSNPQEALHVFKRSLANGQVHDVLRIQANTNGSRQTGFGARINFSFNKYGNVAGGVSSSLGAISVYDANNESSHGTMAFATSERFDKPLADKMWLTHVGNLGIGVENPTYKLEVSGTIRSEEVKVEAAPWPDYVFEEDYDLRSLAETEAYIKANKHLPEIPSAKEIAANGLALGEMNALLLKKIEELTLYILEQEKRIQKLENQQK